MPETARDITALGSAIVLALATIGVVGFLALDRRYAAIGFVLAAVVGGWLLGSLLKSSFDRPRPELVPHLMRVYFSSFPSGHSMMSAVVYGTLGSHAVEPGHPPPAQGVLPQPRPPGLAVLVGASRVYLGVHYPTDVLAGWSAGLAWSTLCWLVARRLQRRRGRSNRLDDRG